MRRRTFRRWPSTRIEAESDQPLGLFRVVSTRDGVLDCLRNLSNGKLSDGDYNAWLGIAVPRVDEDEDYRLAAVYVNILDSLLTKVDSGFLRFGRLSCSALFCKCRFCHHFFLHIIILTSCISSSAI